MKIAAENYEVVMVSSVKRLTKLEHEWINKIDAYVHRMTVDDRMCEQEEKVLLSMLSQFNM